MTKGEGEESMMEAKMFFISSFVTERVKRGKGGSWTVGREEVTSASSLSMDSLETGNILRRVSEGKKYCDLCLLLFGWGGQSPTPLQMSWLRVPRLN